MAKLTHKGIAPLLKQIDAGYQPRFNHELRTWSAPRTLDQCYVRFSSI